MIHFTFSYRRTYSTFSSPFSSADCLAAIESSFGHDVFFLGCPERDYFPASLRASWACLF